jgi:hypothetical protein
MVRAHPPIFVIHFNAAALRFFRVGQDDFRHGELQSMERSAGGEHA